MARSSPRRRARRNRSPARTCSAHRRSYFPLRARRSGTRRTSGRQRLPEHALGVPPLQQRRSGGDRCCSPNDASFPMSSPLGCCRQKVIHHAPRRSHFVLIEPASKSAQIDVQNGFGGVGCALIRMLYVGWWVNEIGNGAIGLDVAQEPGCCSSRDPCELSRRAAVR